jgi:hypothetical protein
MPIGELITWRQLAGDPRMSGALAECDAREWDALALAPKILPYLHIPFLGQLAPARWNVFFEGGDRAPEALFAALVAPDP